MSVFSKIFGDESSKFIKDAEKIVAKINALEADISKLLDEDFPKKTREFKDRLANGETLDDILPEAFALVREAAKRNLKERHYDVQ
ncbi:MAG: Protein translocase subunit SecA, partial [Candidatus Nomurabacteria bacterium GW2011_GWA1_37_20]